MQRALAKEQDSIDHWHPRAFEQLARLDLVLQNDVTTSTEAFETVSHEWLSTFKKRYNLIFDSSLLTTPRVSILNFSRKHYPEHYDPEARWLFRAMKDPDPQSVRDRTTDPDTQGHRQSGLDSY